MPATAKGLRTLAQGCVVAALAAASGVVVGAGPGGGTIPGSLPARSQASGGGDLPPIVTPDAARSQKFGGSAAPAPKAGAANASSRITRLHAAANDLLSPARSQEALKEQADASTSPWMQEIDPSVRSRPATMAAKKQASAVEPVRYQTRGEDRGATVIRTPADEQEALPAAEPSSEATISELPAQNEAPPIGDEATARSGIGKSRSTVGSGLSRMLAMKPASGTSSRRSALIAQQPQQANAADTAQTPVERGGKRESVEANLSSSDQAECRRLEEKLCELFPGREVQIMIGRNHTSPSDQGSGQIIAIIRGGQSGPTATEAKPAEAGSVLKSRTAKGDYYSP